MAYLFGKTFVIWIHDKTLLKFFFAWYPGSAHLDQSLILWLLPCAMTHHPTTLQNGNHMRSFCIMSSRNGRSEQLTDSSCVLQLDLQHLHRGGDDHLTGPSPTPGQHLPPQGQMPGDTESESVIDTQCEQGKDTTTVKTLCLWFLFYWCSLTYTYFLCRNMTRVIVVSYFVMLLV